MRSKDPRMSEQAARLTHPEIEAAAWHVARKLAANVPTMHLAGEPTP